MKLIHSLERIEKKLDKESGSNKSRSHRIPEEKGRFKSYSRHHHFSQRKSKRRTHIISSTSPAMKHKRSWVDEFRGEMNKIKPPTFDGEHKKYEDVMIQVDIGGHPPIPTSLFCQFLVLHILLHLFSIVGSTLSRLSGALHIF